MDEKTKTDVTDIIESFEAKIKRLASNEYRDAVKINKTNLPLSLLDQSDKFLKYATQYAARYSKIKALERKLRRVEGKVERKIRRNPESFGLDSNPKEGAIKATIPVQPEIWELVDEIDQVQAEEQALKQLVTAFEHRRSMLKYLLKALSEGLLALPKSVMEDNVKVSDETFENETRNQMKPRRR